MGTASEKLSGREIVKMAWLATLAAMGFALAAPVMAMADSTRFNIAAQPLPQALKAFAAQAHMQLLYEYGAVAHRRGNAVIGDLDKHSALEQLLRDSGLEIVYSSDAAATIRQMGHTTQAPASPQPDPNQASSPRSSLRLAQALSEQTTGSPQVESRQSAAQASVTLQEVIVTAQKREERLQNVPISISVLSGGSLDSSTSQGVLDELNRVPGVVVLPATEYGNSMIGVRGVAANGPAGDGASPIAYYLDGVPFGFVRSAWIPDSSPFDLQRVEVLRGPQGTLYGASAEDGVVRVITSDADLNAFDLKARAVGSDTDGSSAPNGAGDLAINAPIIDGKLAVRAVGDYQHFAGWIDRPAEKDANSANLSNFRVKLDAQPTDDLSIGLSYWGSRQNLGALSTSLADYSQPAGGTSHEIVENDFDTYALKAAYQFGHFTVSSVTSWLDYRSYSEQDLSPYGEVYAQNGFNVLEFITSHVLSEEILLNSTDTGPWHWTGGAFYRDDTDRYYQTVVLTAVPGAANVGTGDFDDRSRQVALFGQLSRRFLDDKLEWTLGLRQFHDDVSSINNPGQPPYSVSDSYNATTPRAVLSWYPRTELTAYASFSEGFRSGAPQYYGVGAAAPELPGARPDKLYNYELGTKADLLDHRLVLDIALYYVDWKDVQQAILVQTGTIVQNATVNGPSAGGAGVDFALTARPTDGWTVGGTFSWNGLEMNADLVEANGATLFHKGDRLNNSSEYTGSLFASYAFPLGGGVTGTLSASGNYTSKQSTRSLVVDSAVVFYGDNLFFAQAAFTVDFRNSWSLKLYCDNCTNDYGALQGAPAGYGPTTDNLIPRPRPRTVGLEADYRLR